MVAPTVDILLAVYNGERYLRPFLDSLLNQTVQDFRLVVGDNKSTDGTLNILNAYRSRFVHDLVILPPPAKTTTAHENFVRVTEFGSAPYVMYADADDVWHANKIEKTLSIMRDVERKYGTNAPLLVHSDLVVVDEGLNRLSNSYWRYHFVDPRRTNFRQLLMQNCVTGCTVMVNHTLFELGRPLPPESFVHDYWYALVASLFGKVVAIPEPLIEYRQHGANVTGAKRWSSQYILCRAMALYSSDGPSARLERNIAQAAAIVRVFSGKLSCEQECAARVFASLKTRNFLLRRYLIIRYGFWKRGLIRNLGLLASI